MKFPWNKAAEKVETLKVQIIEQKEVFENQIVEQRQQFEVKLHETEELTLKAAQSVFDKAIKNLSLQISPNYQSGVQQRAYQRSPGLNAVVSLLANTAASIPFYPQLPNGDDSPENDKVFDFLKLLTQEKKIQAYSYWMLKGEIFGFMEKLDFGINAGIQNITILHPDNIEVLITQTFPVTVAGFLYWDNVIGDKKFIDVEDMIFIKNFNPDPDVYQQVRGLPPPKVIEKILSRDSAGVDVSVAQLQNGGNPGVLYDKMPGYESGAMGKRQENFARFLNNRSNKGAPYFSQGEMGYIAIGSTLVDMDLVSLSAENLDIICNLYHISSTELNNKNASTMNNVTVHGKSLYTKGALPIVHALVDGINEQALIFVKTKSIIKPDTSDIPELQKDLKATADAMAAMPFIVPNDMLEKLGWKRRPESIMDEVWAKSGYMLMEDVSAVDDIDNTAGDYQAPVVPLKNSATK